MNREEIRLLARGLIDEYTEEPEGLFKDDEATQIDLNTLINLAQQNVHLDILPHIPWYFRKWVLISLVKDKREYNVVTDLSITDFLMFQDIYYNEAGKKPDGLLYAEIDQFSQLEVKVGEKGDPRLWSYEQKDVIAFDPTPSAAYADKYRAPYFFELPDLNEDTSHDPSTNKYAIPALPKAAHVLVAIDTARQCHLIGEEEMGALDKRYNFHFAKCTNNLFSITPSFSERDRRPLKDRIR